MFFIYLRNITFLALLYFANPFHKALLSGHQFLSNHNPNENWEKISAKNEEVIMYERWVKVEEDLNVRERKGIFTINCPLDHAVSVLENTEKTPEWMAGVRKSHRIDLPVQEGYYTYTLYKIPWPFSDRDLISHFKKNEIKKNKVVIDISSNSNLIPEKKNVTRMQKYTAKWIIEEIEPGLIQVTFTAISHEKASFPRWVMDPVLKKVFSSNLYNLKQLMSELQE